MSTVDFLFLLWQKFGFTDVCPDNKPVPSDVYACRNYWIWKGTSLKHNGERKRRANFDLANLKVGQSVGCCVTRNGELRYFIDGIDQNIVWTDFPTDRRLWGVADLFSSRLGFRSIKSEFLFGEYSITLKTAPTWYYPSVHAGEGYSTQLCVRMCVCVSLTDLMCSYVCLCVTHWSHVFVCVSVCHSLISCVRMCVCVSLTDSFKNSNWNFWSSSCTYS